MPLFVASFLVLFLETAIIRWMPAYIRLLAYFSNFILLASFLGIGIGCLLASRRRPLILWFPLVQLAAIVAVDRLRLEVALPSTSTIYFSSGTAEPVVPVESTLLLPLLFTAVAALFAVVAHRMGVELARHPPLRAYVINLVGSLAGVAGFAIVSWMQLPPAVWFGVAAAAALPFVIETRRPIAIVNVALLAAALLVVYRMQGDSLWSPYYRITVFQDRDDTVVEVNHIFHQSMAPVDRKEYFYQWPYAVFGDTFDNVLILGAGSGTDVAAALKHGAKHVDAVDIDPVILRLGAERHPDRPYSDPRVTIVNDDARHFLRTTTRRYDLIVFALIDSLTVQSSFSGVRLESYMFTRESFDAVRDHLAPNGVMALYNYFRERWLVDRLANTAADAFGRDPLAHVHQERAYLAVMLAGPRAAALAAAARAEPGDAPRARRERAGRDRRLAVPLHARAGAAAPLRRRAGGGPRPLGGRRVGGARPGRRPLVVAFLLSGRRLHAARDEIDRAVRAALGIDVVVGVARHRVGARDGARERDRGQPRRDPPPMDRRRRAARARRRELRRAGGTRDLREPRARVALLRRARVQPGLLRRPALQLQLQGVLVDGQRLRRESSRRDGRRRGRISVAPRRLPVLADPRRGVLRGGDRDAANCGTRIADCGLIAECGFGDCGLIADCGLRNAD